MTTYNVSKSFQWQGRITDRVASVMEMFGLSFDRLKNNGICHKCQINLRPGDICFITGPSGAGKTVLLREIFAQSDSNESLMLESIPLENDMTLIDCVEGDCMEALKSLSRAGLNDVFCVLNQPANLSDGQKWRYRMARAIASDKKLIFSDEFCSNLDRITAAVIAWNIHKYARTSDKIFILATSHEDLLCDLRPDVVVIKHLAGQAEVIYRDCRRGKRKTTSKQEV